MWILAELARRLGHDWPEPVAEDVWDELRSLSPMHAGMSYARLEEHGGLQWPCPDEEHPGSPFLHGRLWAEPLGGPPAPFSVVEAQGPFEALDAEYPIRLTTGRRLESYNTGAQSNLYRSPLHRGESLDLSPEDAERLELADGEIARVSSRRGSVEAPVRIDPSLRPGLAFMTFHFPDEVDTNQLTIDATDPEVGHGGVQGGGDPGREARACRARRDAPASPSRPTVGRAARRWICTSFPAPSRRRPSAPPSTACSAAARDGWDGGARLVGPAGNTASTGHAARERRHLLLPALWALQERIGWISPGGLNELCRRLTIPPADAYGVATFYAHARRRAAARPSRARLRGHRLPLPRLRRADRAARGALRRRGRALGRRLGHVVSQPVPRPVRPRSGGARRRCRRRAGGADARADDRGRACSACSPAASPARPPVDRAAAGRRSGAAAAPPAAAASGAQPRRLPGARRLRRAAARVRARARGRDPRGEGLEAPGPRRRRLPDRRQVGGRRAAAGAPALPRLQRRRVGAGHVQGPGDHGARSLRADRGDDDRRLRHRLRARLRLHPRRVPGVAARARARRSTRRAGRGFLGDDVLGEGFRFDIEIRKGAGAYICGEETAIFNSIEGDRGEPRNKPPFPVVEGLFGKPTVVNNVETLVNVLDIVLRSGPVFAETGTDVSTGPKLFCLSGHVARPGVYEVPFGATPARAARARRRRGGQRRAPERPAGRRRGRLRRARTSSTCR